VKSHQPINLIAVGDICPGDHTCVGFGTGTLMRSHGPTFALRQIATTLRQGDIVFGNCEGVLSDIGLDESNIDTMEFRGLPAFAKALADSGFTTINIANNHVGEYGPQVMHDTIRNLEKAGIDVVGLRGKTQTAKPLVREVKGLRIGWLAYTWIVSKNMAEDQRALSWAKGDEIPREVALLRDKVDFLIVSAHWGREFVAVPSQNVINHAHAIAEAGADLVLGHHPHVLQGWETVGGKCVIVYSLGNFVFDEWQWKLRKTALFCCTIASGKVHNPQFVPLTINRKFQPELARMGQAARILRDIDTSTKAINDPALCHLRDDARAVKVEAQFRRRILQKQILFLAASIGRMGPRIAYQKLRRRVPMLPNWLQG